METAAATLDVPIETPNDKPPPGLEPGRRLGPYELLLPIASGGMGHVWAAARIGEFGFRRKVAVKVMRQELAMNGEFRRMFLDEARLASTIVHTNVVEVLDLGVDDGELYQAMALVDGASLANLAQIHAKNQAVPIPIEIAIRIVLDVLRGLHAAHELPIELVHRDVSPQNILVGLDGVSKITDFGIAKANGAVEGPSTSGAKGKVAYMAPEQLGGLAVDRRADVFAIGVVLWELLAGVRPKDPAKRLLAGETIEPPPPREDRGASELSIIAMRALAADPNARYASAAVMADTIEAAAHSMSLAVSQGRVSAWTRPLAAERVQQRNIDADAQLARSQIDLTVQEAPKHTLPLDAAPNVSTAKSPRKKAGLAIAGLLAVFLVGASTLAIRKSETTSPAPATSTSAEAVAPRDSPLPTAAPTSENSSEAIGASSTASAAASSATNATSHRHRHLPPPKPATAASGQSPKYANPYAN